MPKDTHYYSNGEVTVVWKPQLCIHSRRCFTGLPQVFDPTKRPWVNAQGASTQEIIDQVNKCPSGALSYKIDNAEPIPESITEARMSDVSAIIECQPNGPLLTRGPVVIKKSDGTEEIREGAVALCRCGQSGNKPFCDGSHRRVGFQG